MLLSAFLTPKPSGRPCPPPPSLSAITAIEAAGGDAPASIPLPSRINIHGSAGCVCAMAVSLAFDPLARSLSEHRRANNRASFEVQRKQLLALISIHFHRHPRRRPYIHRCCPRAHEYMHRVYISLTSVQRSIF